MGTSTSTTTTSTTTSTSTTTTTITTTTTTQLICDDGFFKKNGVCNDINECSHSKKNNCNKNNGICTNTPGSFTCFCKEGFEGDGVTCKKITTIITSTTTT